MEHRVEPPDARAYHRQNSGRALRLFPTLGPDLSSTPSGFSLSAEGARRAYRVRLGEPSLQHDGNDLVLRFALPKGSYATVVLDEIIKG